MRGRRQSREGCTACRWRSRALASATRGMRNLFQLEDILCKMRLLLRELLDHAGHPSCDWPLCAVSAGRLEDQRSACSCEQQDRPKGEQKVRQPVQLSSLHIRHDLWS
eukprot:s2863_g20.t1